jgi:hypothetical protein
MPKLRKALVNYDSDESFADSDDDDEDDDDEDDDVLLEVPDPAGQAAASAGVDFSELEAEEASTPNGINILKDDRFGVEKCQYDRTGKMGWRCTFCLGSWAGVHAFKELAHIAKVSNYGVLPCTSFIPADSALMYKKLHSIRIENREKKKAIREAVVDGANADHDRGFQALAQQPGKKQNAIRKFSSPANSLGFLPLSNTKAASTSKPPSGRKSTPRSSSRSTPRSAPSTTSAQSGRSTGQVIDLTPRSLVQTKIAANAPNPEASLKLDHAIADLIHCNALSFALAEDAKFRKVIKLAKAVPQSYNPPTRKAIGGKLLESNFQSLQAQNDELLLQDAQYYGLAVFGDAATIARTPFVNLLASSPNHPAVCLEVHDCTEQW